MLSHDLTTNTKLVFGKEPFEELLGSKLAV